VLEPRQAFAARNPVTGFSAFISLGPPRVKPSLLSTSSINAGMNLQTESGLTRIYIKLIIAGMLFACSTPKAVPDRTFDLYL
jgi:hypothetical protein